MSRDLRYQYTIVCVTCEKFSTFGCTLNVSAAFTDQLRQYRGDRAISAHWIDRYGFRSLRGDRVFLTVCYQCASSHNYRPAQTIYESTQQLPDLSVNMLLAWHLLRDLQRQRFRYEIDANESAPRPILRVDFLSWVVGTWLNSGPNSCRRGHVWRLSRGGSLKEVNEQSEPFWGAA